MKYFFVSVLLYISSASFSQNEEAKIFRITSPHSSFPDTARAKGHRYNNVFYEAAGHYSDSSVLIIVPKKLKAGKKLDLVFWFHGWWNNIDSAARRFELIKQFTASGINSVLVLAETARNAPDSYGGKLEYTDVFRKLVTDIMLALKKEKVVPGKCRPGHLLLAGHSGAYRVMAHILSNGNMPVREVILFDALYAQADKYMHWIHSGKSHRFINIYTDDGGTDAESKEMVKSLHKAGIQAATVEEEVLTPSLLSTQKILFIHSPHKHNEIINNPDNFRLFLENTPILKKIRH